MTVRHQRSDFVYFSDVSTRWMDNDVYGHINNVVYYSYFDSVVNQYLIEKGGLDIHSANVVGFVVASRCEYLAPIAYPDKIQVGLRVNKIGNSSVEYELAIFKTNEVDVCAVGSFTHVFVDRKNSRSTVIPETIRLALTSLLIT